MDQDAQFNGDTFFFRVPLRENLLDSVVLECTNGVLTVTGETKTQDALFERTFPFPEEAVPARIRAFVQDGVLHIEAPRFDKPLDSIVRDLPEAASVYYRVQC